MRVKVLTLAVAVILAAMLTVRAADTGRGKLTQPWSKISSLTDDQKSKITEIHKKALDEKKAIEKREHDECVAVLNDEQKKELETLEKDSKGSKKKPDAATSAPTP